MSSFAGFINNAALMLILCVIYDTFGIYAIQNRYLRDCLTGVLVGIIGITVMLNPWSLQPGVFFDTRWVLLSLCGLFFGFRPTVVAVIMTGAFRLYQGGAGGTVGTIVIVVTACVGVFWRYWRQRYGKRLDWKELYLFGVVVQLAMLSCMSLMPPEMRIPIIKATAPPILAIFPILTLLIGLILQRQEERRDAEKELQENRKALSLERGMLRGVITAIPDLIFFKDRAGRYLGCNASFESFTGRTEARLTGKSDFDLYDRKTAEIFSGNDRKMLEDGQLVKTEEWVVYPDGRKVLLDTVKSPFKDLSGNIQGFVGISRDITERKIAETRLDAERERLLVTLRSIGDGVITTDVDGVVQLINTVAEKLTGWTQAEAHGRHITEIFHIFHEKTRELCENPVSKVISTGKIVELANHTALLAKNGIERSIADSAAPIQDADNAVVGVVLVFRDVTEQMRTEQELIKIKKLESIGILAGGIAHDFNNILAAVLGNINIALLDTTLGDETQRILSEAEKASIRARELAKQLLTFAKGGAPVKELSLLQDVIRHSADFVLHGNTVSCTYDIPEDLWLVDIDKGQIGQVIQNIVLNASQAMPEGGVITISCRNISYTDEVESWRQRFPLLPAQEQYVEICIQDQGGGIPPTILDKVFDPYFSTKNDGTGLGLSIAHSIISSHDGCIDVESSPGKGTLFRIFLPASADTREIVREAEEALPISAKRKILIMDDEEMVRNVIRSMLSQLGHEAILVSNGEDAIRLYKDNLQNREPFDLVIMDLTIPGGMGGKDAVRILLELDPAARVIVSSGYSDDPIMAGYKAYGFCGAIEKPYRIQELAAVINQAMS